MFDANPYRLGELYYELTRQEDGHESMPVPVVWRCVSVNGAQTQGVPCRSCGDGLSFERVTEKVNSEEDWRRLWFTWEFEAAEEMLTWDEFVDACLFWIPLEPEPVQEIASVDRPLPKTRRYEIIRGDEDVRERLRELALAGPVEQLFVAYVRSNASEIGFSELHSLKDLNFQRSIVSNRMLATIGPSIRTLFMEKCVIDRGAGVLHDRFGMDLDGSDSHAEPGTLADSIRRLSETLQKLLLDGTPICDCDLMQLSPQAPLESLCLAGTMISDDCSDIFENLPHLRYLDLSNTDISDATLMKIGACRNLRSLRIQRTPVTDRGFEVIAALPCLEDLWARGTDISREALFRFRDERADCTIHM